MTLTFQDDVTSPVSSGATDANSYTCSIVTNRVCVSSHFRDNGPQTFWGHDLHVSRSRDVIGHVTIRFAIGYFLLVAHWNRFIPQIRDQLARLRESKIVPKFGCFGAVKVRFCKRPQMSHLIYKFGSTWNIRTRGKVWS